MTEREDWRLMQRAIKRLGAYGRMWKRGNDCGLSHCGLSDIGLATDALQALERRRDGIRGMQRPLEFWEPGVQEVDAQRKA